MPSGPDKKWPMRRYLTGILTIIGLSAVTSVPVNAGDWKHVDRKDSHILFSLEGLPVAGYRFMTKGWDDGYRYKTHYFGNGGSLGEDRLVKIWYYELSGGVHYKSKENVSEFPSRWKILKQRSNIQKSSGTYNSSFGIVDYMLFDSDGVSCAVFGSTFGSNSGHIGSYAGTARMKGYTCARADQTLTQEDVQIFLSAIGIKDYGDPKLTTSGSATSATSPKPDTTSTSKRTLAPSRETSQGSVETRLGELKRLLDKGLISQEDYEEQKRKILADL